MKKLIFQITIPVTLITFFLLNKWRYGEVIDGALTFFYGFPFISSCAGFHTSHSTQYFITETALNLLIYFVFWLTFSLLINKYIPLKIHKIIPITFWIIFIVIMSGFVYISNQYNDRYKLTRDFDVKIYESGFMIITNTHYQDDIRKRNAYFSLDSVKN